MATVSTLGNTVKSLLGTITVTANSVSQLVNTTGKSIGMLDSFVTQAAEDQTAKQLVHREIFINNLVAESAQETAEADIKALEFCKKSAEHDQAYRTARTRFEAILAAHRPKAEAPAEA